jgi:hypothetical protein
MLVRRSNHWRNPLLWLGVSIAAVYLALLGYFVWQILLATT